MISGPEAIVNLAALRANIRLLRARVAPSTLMLVVKDDAYAHGLDSVVRTARDEGVEWIGSLDAHTSLRVRELFPEASLFAWLLDPNDDPAPLVAADVHLGVSTEAQLERFASSELRANVHVKVDTGLHRAGAGPQEWPGLVRRAVELEGAGRIRLAGAWTHISEASDDEDTRSIARFTDAVTVATEAGANFEMRHLAASAAAYERDDSRFDMVRIGAFAYGIAPGDGIGPAELGLTPVMTLRAPVTSVDGDRAAIAAGFGDGLLGALAGRASIAVRGRRRAIRQVGVDRTLIEHDGDIAVGDVATLFGPGLDGEATLQEWADAISTIGEEIVVRVSPRVPRRYVGD